MGNFCLARARAPSVLYFDDEIALDYIKLLLRRMASATLN